ncbi:MAG TPA: DUF2795 domain-containing protein [Dictyobacter sp.]|jgi:hypothetical protein|nr:DUF2795 domain-containing protein [Dictyobacter sp.]
MNIDQEQIKQLVSQVHFPVNRDQIIQVAKDHGANNLVIGLLQRLPDKTYNSPQDVRNELGNLGGFKI